jgi:hypothetical protein
MNLEHIINEKELYLKTYSMKKFITVERLCKGLPPEIAEYFKYVKLLKFQEEPNYDYLRNLFKDLLKKNGFEDYENLTFSWVVPSNLSKSKNIKKKNVSPLGRLYYKIKNQIESHKVNSQIKYSNTKCNQNINSNKTFNDLTPNNDKQLLNISDKIVTLPTNNINKPNDFMQNSNLDKGDKIIISNKEIFAKKNRLIKKENRHNFTKYKTENNHKIDNILNTNTNTNTNNNKGYNEGKISNIYKKINNYNNYNNYTKMENNAILYKVPNTKMRKTNINTYNSNYNSVNNNGFIHKKSNTIISPKNFNNDHLKLTNYNARNYLISNDKLKLNNQPKQNLEMRNELLNVSYKPLEPNYGGKNFYFYKQNLMMMNNYTQNQNNSSFKNPKLYNSANHY